MISQSLQTIVHPHLTAGLLEGKAANGPPLAGKFSRKLNFAKDTRILIETSPLNLYSNKALKSKHLSSKLTYAIYYFIGTSSHLEFSVALT